MPFENLWGVFNNVKYKFLRITLFLETHCSSSSSSSSSSFSRSTACLKKKGDPQNFIFDFIKHSPEVLKWPQKAYKRCITEIFNSS